MGRLGVLLLVCKDKLQRDLKPNESPTLGFPIINQTSVLVEVTNLYFCVLFKLHIWVRVTPYPNPFPLSSGIIKLFNRMFE